MRKLLAAVVLMGALPALAQVTNDLNSTGPAANNSYIAGGQSNLLGSNIGVQNNTNTGGNTVTPADTTAKVTTVPTVYAPGLTAGGSDVCLGSASGSFSVLGLGLSGGKTYVDENCVLLKNSQRLAAMGFNGAAVVMLMADKAIAAAMRSSAPAIYHQVMHDRAENLKAEIEVAAELGEKTDALKLELAAVTREVKILSKRMATSSVQQPQQKVTEEKPSGEAQLSKPVVDTRTLNPR